MIQRAIRNVRNGCPTVQLYNCGMLSEDVDELFDALQGEHVEDLCLEENWIGSVGVERLVRVLPNILGVQRLFLGGNDIRDDGAVLLANAIPACESLTVLDLYYNSIGDAGAQALATALIDNTTLLELNLDQNRIGDVGAQALAAALTQNANLRECYLSSENLYGPVGTQALVDALRVNFSILRLNGFNTVEQIVGNMYRRKRILREILCRLVWSKTRFEPMILLMILYPMLDCN